MTGRPAHVLAQVLVRVLVLGGVLLAAASPAAACAVCFGAADDPMTGGLNNGILFLLGTIGLVQVGFVALFVRFRRRAKHLEERRAQFHLIEGGVR